MLAITPLTVTERVIAIFATLSALALTVLAVLIGRAGAIEAEALFALRHMVDHSGTGWRALHLLMDTATAIGSFPMLVIVLIGSAGFLASIDRGGTAMRLIARSAVGMGIGEATKLLVARPRPEVVEHWQAVSSWSLPSGHTTNGTLVYLLLAQLAIKAAPSGRAHLFLLCFALLLVILIGISRLYLGVHWPSDVLAGWSFGAAWALVAGRINATYFAASRPRSQT